MATANLIPQGFKAVKHMFSPSIPILSGKAGGTLSPGLPLRTTNGLLVLGAQGDSTTLVGLAASAGVLNGTINYIPFLPGIIFEATIDNGTTTGTTPLADTMRFEAFGLGVDTGNFRPFINVADVTNALFMVLDFAPGAVLGAQYQRVYVTPSTASMIWNLA
jgi:hypothetical protein